MSNKQLTVLIGGREALLVRAIPYVTGWQRFSPDFVANNLAQNFKQIWCDESAGLTAYHLSNGIPIAVHPREWDAIVVNLKSFEAKLQQENSNDDIGYAAWRADAVSLLPSDALVWLDEFKEKYQADKESLLYVEMKPSNAELILTPLLDANTRAIVLEGVTGILDQRFSDYSDMPASELPGQLRKLAPAWWDSLGVEKRQELAKNFSDGEDPSLENARQHGFNLFEEIDEVKKEIECCKGWVTNNTPSEEKIKEAKLIELNDKLAELEEQWTLSVPSEAEQAKWKAEGQALSEKEIKERHDKGRYTLDEAAKLIGDNAPISANFILKEMVNSVRTSELIVYKPNRVEPYKPKLREGAVWVERDCPPPKKQVLTWYAEAFWNDLNLWLENNPECVRVEYRFEDPGTPLASKGKAGNIPGKMPRTTIGKLAITEAWKIECETGKRATANQVIAKLQTMVGTHPDLAEKGARKVGWFTCMGAVKYFDTEGCGKALQKWNASRP